LVVVVVFLVVVVVFFVVVVVFFAVVVEFFAVIVVVGLMIVVVVGPLLISDIATIFCRLCVGFDVEAVVLTEVLVVVVLLGVVWLE